MSATVAILPARMGQWPTKYTDLQRGAIEYAYVDLRTRPVAKIHRQAEAGELVSGAGGEVVPAFEIPYGTLIGIGKEADRRRRGEKLAPGIAAKAPRDQAEYLQRRLVAAVDHELSRIEKQQAKDAKFALDPRHARDMARLLKEIATLPDPQEKRLPPVPGQRDADGQKPEAATRSGLGASILAASDRSMSPSTRAEAANTTGRTTGEHDTPHSAPATHDDEHHEPHNHDNQRSLCSPSYERVPGESGDVSAAAVVAG